MSSSEVTERLKLPFIMPSQAQKHVTHNEALIQLDRMIHPVAASRTTMTPPSGEPEGTFYIVATGATGAWAGHQGEIAAVESSGWTFLSPPAGFNVFVEDEQAFVHFDGSSWQRSPESLSRSEFDSLAVNTQVDPAARFAVGSDTIILSHDAATPGTGDMRIQANKAEESRTASMVFQTNWSGRAEIGLCGSNDLSFKVSGDGSTWKTALTVNAATGRPLMPAGISVGEQTTGAGDIVIARSGAAFSLRDPVNVGNAHTGFLNWVDGNGDEKVWCGLGSSSNTLFSFLSHYPDGLAFYAFGGNYPIEFRQGVDGNQVRLRIHTNGYVGVNHTAPTAPLHVGGALRVGSSTVAALPSAPTLGAGTIIFVSDETGGATLAFSDGSSWRRIQDRAVVA